jgi:uncharacterized repeat protein (TIGR01451 family)
MHKVVAVFSWAALSVCLQAAQLPVTMGPVLTSFTVLAGSAVTNTGPTAIVGNVGVSAGTSVGGFPPGTVTGGAIYTGVGSLAGTAQAQLTAAYNDALSRTGFTSVAGNLDGQTLPPGLYKSTSTLGLGVGGVLYLNGAANSVFIFQVASALNMSNSSQVVLEGGVTAANIFWQVGSSASLGTYSTFNGTILAYASITLATGSTMNGRALAEVGAVTMDTNPMANPGAAITTITPPPPTVTCPLSTAQVGVAYNSLLSATGGTPPYAFSTTGSLPSGLNLVPATGFLIGTPTLAGTFPFSANVLDSASATGTSSCSIVVAAASADVSIVKTGPTFVAPNANITYNLAVANAGPSFAAGVTVSDTLPAGTTLVSATPSVGSCSGTSTVSCSLGTVFANGVATVVLVVRSSSTPGTVSNTATVSSTTPDPNLANNTSTWNLTATTTPPLNVTCPVGVAQIGIAYNSSLTASGGTSPYTFSITGSLPPVLSLNTSTGAIAGNPTTAGTYPFSTNVRDSLSGTATNNTCSIVVAADQADVSITKTGPTTVVVNGNITYTLTVTNAGPSPAVNVTLGDILPVRTTFVSATPSVGSCSGTSTVSCSLGTMAVGGSATITLVVAAPSSSGTVANTAIVASTTPDPNLANNTSTATVTATGVAAVPTLSTWGLALLALLLLLAGCSVLFSRKAQV